MQPGDVGRNWRANTWIRVNYMIYHGLKNFGYPGLASSLAQRTSELAAKAGDREYYNSENGEGAGASPFRGSSLLVHFFLLEETLDWDITEINTDPQ
jgi:hypothetical protein